MSTGIHVNQMSTILLLQETIVRIVADAQPRGHTDPLFSRKKFLKADQIHELLIGRLMFTVEILIYPDTILLLIITSVIAVREKKIITTCFSVGRIYAKA